MDSDGPGTSNLHLHIRLAARVRHGGRQCAHVRGRVSEQRRRGAGRRRRVRARPMLESRRHRDHLPPPPSVRHDTHCHGCQLRAAIAMRGQRGLDQAVAACTQDGAPSLPRPRSK
jgi:hypothetical protein